MQRMVPVGKQVLGDDTVVVYLQDKAKLTMVGSGETKCQGCLNHVISCQAHSNKPQDWQTTVDHRQVGLILSTNSHSIISKNSFTCTYLTTTFIIAGLCAGLKLKR